MFMIYKPKIRLFEFILTSVILQIYCEYWIPTEIFSIFNYLLGFPLALSGEHCQERVRCPVLQRVLLLLRPPTGECSNARWQHCVRLAKNYSYTAGHNSHVFWSLIEDKYLFGNTIESRKHSCQTNYVSLLMQALAQTLVTRAVHSNVHSEHIQYTFFQMQRRNEKTKL